MIPPTLTAKSLVVGQAVPVLERAWPLPRLVAYAGATWDWHPLHYDAAYVAARRLRAAVVDGQAFGAILAEALLDWLGPRAVIRRLGFRLKSMMFAGETLACAGEVTALTAEGDHDVVTVAQHIMVGDRLVVHPATAEVVLPR